MDNENEIQRLRTALLERFPDAKTVTTPPLHSDGWWTLDVAWKGRWWVLGWRSPDRFELSMADQDTDYGDGPDETFQDYEAWLKRTLALIEGP